MRPLEWLLLLSFIPVLLVPFISQTRRQRWLFGSALPLALIGGLHLVAEGWRVQMMPIYLLVVIALATMLPALARRESRSRRRLEVLASIATAPVLVVCGILAGWVLPVVTLPDPTGPFRVGIVDRELVDEARGRRLMVSVWYPAAQVGAPAPLTQYPNEVATALGNLTSLPGLTFQHLRYTKLAASNDVPMTVEGKPFPILVFSHGMVGLRLQNSSTLQELASWGYIVIAIDHTDTAAVTVFPDGEARFYSLEPFGISAAEGTPDKTLITERVFPVWVADQRFVYDMLEEWAVDDPLLANKLDLERIGSFGHSFGGATALEVCRIDPRCRAAANLDGGLYGQVVVQPAIRPLMLMSSAESGQYTDTVAEWTRLIANADAAYWLELPNSNHFSFTITQLLSPILAPENYDPHTGLRIVDKYLRLFFDIHLGGREAKRGQSECSDIDVRWLSENLCEY